MHCVPLLADNDPKYILKDPHHMRWGHWDEDDKTYFCHFWYFHIVSSAEKENGSILFEANTCVVYDNFSVYCSSEVSIHFHKSSFPYCCCLPFLTWCLHQDIDRTQRSKKWERVHVRVIEGQVLWIIQHNYAEHLFLTILLFFFYMFQWRKEIKIWCTFSGLV